MEPKIKTNVENGINVSLTKGKSEVYLFNKYGLLANNTRLLQWKLFDETLIIFIMHAKCVLLRISIWDIYNINSISNR